MPTVSVIIPTFNRDKLVLKAIDSILAQTYKDYEIIVVDDGSTDSTKEVLEPYMDKIRYIYQENTGVSAARNTGIRAASGQWIAFLDSDDIWLPEKLTCQLECVERNGVKVCFTNSLNYNSAQALHREPVALKKPLVQEKVFADPLELILPETPGLYLPSMLVARSLLEKVGCFDEHLIVGEDTKLIFALAFETSFAFIYTPYIMIDRAEKHEGLTNSSFQMYRARCYAQISILTDAYFRYRRNNRTVIKMLRRKLGYAFSSRAQIACMNNNYYNARRFAKDALHYGCDFKNYLKSIVVCLCPLLVAKRYKRVWNQNVNSSGENVF